MSDRSDRIRPVDTMRGLLLALMVFGNYLWPLRVTPAWLKHARPLQGLNLIDLGFPCFVFLFGLLAPLSYSRRLHDNGRLRTGLHFARRYGLLILFGLLGNLILRQNPLHNWGVLQALGLAGFVSAPFLSFRPALRAAAGLILIGLYAAALRAGYGDWLLANERMDLGGIIGALPWAGLILVASFLAPWLADLRTLARRGLALGIATILAGVMLSFVFPVTKPLVTPSYALLCAGIAGVILALFILLDLTVKRDLVPLLVLGTNSLVVFMLSAMLTTGSQLLYEPRSFAAALGVAAAVGLVCYWVSLRLYRGNILIKL